MYLSDTFYENRKLEHMVENQTTYSLANAEMHVFETHQRSHQVQLRFGAPVLATMLEGKKIMHLGDSTDFDFLPGESLILPANELMTIDFPEAKLDQPTRCLAMSIDEAKIRSTIDYLNEVVPKCSGQKWSFADYNFHFTNDTAIHQIIQRLLFLFTENHASKDVFADFMLQELIIRIVQAETRKVREREVGNDDRLGRVLKYMRSNLDKHLTIEELSQRAYMSTSSFYRLFKNEMGVTPIQYLNSERIKKAKRMVEEGRHKMADIAMVCGYGSESYFFRTFKKHTGHAPSQYRDRYTRIGSCDF